MCRSAGFDSPSDHVTIIVDGSTLEWFKKIVQRR